MRLNGHGYELKEPAFPGSKKPLYNLDKIGADPNADVWIVEGEKAADALTKLGVVATTSGGAQSVLAADWTPLRGRRCIIWRDNDPTGMEYAGEVAATLLEQECQVSATDVDSLQLPTKGDAADWVEINPGATVADLDRLPRIAANTLSMASSATDGVQTSNAWSQPQPLVSKVEPETYPLDALPDLVRDAILRKSLGEVFPEVANSRIDYCWGGMVDMTRDRLPRAGEREGLFYSMGYSGHGTHMSTYMGAIMGEVLDGKANLNPWRDFDWPAIPGHFGKPWFLPIVGAYYRYQDLVR